MRENDTGSERITAGLLFDACRQAFDNNESFAGEGRHAGMLALAGIYADVKPGVDASIGLFYAEHHASEDGSPAPSYTMTVDVTGAKFRLKVFEFGESTLGLGIEPSKSDPAEAFLKFGLLPLENTDFDTKLAK